MSFEAAFIGTVGSEGRYSNNPADHGGATCWGITEAVARAHGYTEPMETMPLDVAQRIYRASYWDVLHLDLIDAAVSPSIAAELFDTAVNMGQSVPIPFLQRALNAFNQNGTDYPQLKIDGVLGKMTADALAMFLKKRGAQGRDVMLYALNAQQGVRYFEIAEANPSQKTFEYGWWAEARRLDSLTARRYSDSSPCWAEGPP